MYQEVSHQLGIQTIGLLCTWVIQFKTYGEIPEPRKRGKPGKLEVKNQMKASNKSSAEDKILIQELERQLRYAHIEVDYLKGLREARLNKK